MYSFIRRLFATEIQQASRRARVITNPCGTRRCRTRLRLEGLEDRLVPSTVYEVVPPSSPTDATHFHTFAVTGKRSSPRSSGQGWRRWRTGCSCPLP